MPQAIPVALAFAKTAVGKLLIGAAINLAVNTVIAKINRPKGPAPRDVQSQIRSGSADRTQHFGRVRTSGTVMFSDWAEVGGTRRAFVLLAISTGGITSVDQYYLDGKPVTVNGDGWVQTAPWTNRVRLRSRTGRPPEFAGGFWTDLHSAFPTRWVPGQHQLDGVATILAEFNAVSPEQVQEVYPSGSPPEVSAVVRGRQCYEPATGDESFTTNPIRHLLHYLSSAGSGTIPISEFDIPVWLSAIPDCNDNLPRAGGTRQRYTAGLSYLLSEPQKDVATRMLEGVGGQLYLTQSGLIGVRVAKWRVPTAVIDESKIVSLDVGPGRAKMDRVTTLVPEYVEPSLDYTETTADPWEDARAISRFGEPKPRELSLLTVQHHGQARALAKIEAARENPRITAAIALRFWGLRLMGEERVYLDLPDHGLNMVPMRIMGMSLDLNAGDGVVKVELESEDPASFDWTSAEEGAKPASPSLSSHERPAIEAPLITDVSVANGVIQGTVPPLSGYVTRMTFRPSGGNWAALDINQATGFFRTPPLPDGQTHEIRARRVLAGLSSVVGAIHSESQTDITRFGPYTTLTGIVVVANQTPPAQPEVVSATRSGDTITIVFRPDLGANYAQTGIWRGANFDTATFIRWVRDQASTVTVTITNAPAPATYWLRSGNGSGIASAPLNIGTL